MQTPIKRIAPGDGTAFYEKSSLLEDGGAYYFVFWTGTHFVAQNAGSALYLDGDKEIAYVVHPTAVAYGPIHSSMTLTDVHGARYTRDDGTHWTDFAHEAPGERHDAIAYTQAKLISHFQPRINKQSALVHAAADITERTLRHNVMVALNEFVDAAMVEASRQFAALPLGHHTREAPYADNHRALVVASIRAVFDDWTKRGATDTEARHNSNRVQSAVNELVASLTQAPKVLTRVEDYDAAKPKVVEQIAAQTMVAGGAAVGISLAGKFTARDVLEFTAVSSDTAIVMAVIGRGLLTITALKAGSVTITLRAEAPDERYAEQTFTVTAVASQ